MNRVSNYAKTPICCNEFASDANKRTFFILCISCDSRSKRRKKNGKKSQNDPKWYVCVCIPWVQQFHMTFDPIKTPTTDPNSFRLSIVWWILFRLFGERQRKKKSKLIDLLTMLISTVSYSIYIELPMHGLPEDYYMKLCIWCFASVIPIM